MSRIFSDIIERRDQVIFKSRLGLHQRRLEDVALIAGRFVECGLCPLRGFVAATQR